MKRILFSLSILLTNAIVAEDSVSSAFSNIYENKIWGANDQGEGISGKGSVFENAKEYVAFLKGFLAAHSCKSVVDIGCGDWELSKNINWDSIQYRGYDVVQKVIDKNNTLYGSPNIQFFCDDAILSKTPPADLLLCKDVLQHLPTNMVKEFFKKLPNYKYCLLTNDVAMHNNAVPANGDCSLGDYRPLNLMKEPFNLKATVVLTFCCPETTKQVLLIERQ
jgi:hypothetical protein